MHLHVINIRYSYSLSIQYGFTVNQTDFSLSYFMVRTKPAMILNYLLLKFLKTVYAPGLIMMDRSNPCPVK